MTSIYKGMAASALDAFKVQPNSRPQRARVASLLLGIVTLIAALGGVVYNVSTFASVLGGATDEAASVPELPHFRTAFYVMSAVCLSCYGLMILGACRMLRGRSYPTTLLVLVWAFEVLYFFLVGASWLLPGIGSSIAGATGVANGGLMFQFAILLPLWGPLLALWIGRHRSPAG